MDIILNKPSQEIVDHVGCIWGGYTRIKEITAILSESLLRLKQPVEKIETTEHGYLVTTDDYTMKVDLEYIPVPYGMCGNSDFKLVFHPPEPRHSNVLEDDEDPCWIDGVSPAVTRRNEMNAILSDPRLIDRCVQLNQPVEKIEKTELGYLITLRDYTMQVDVEPVGFAWEVRPPFINFHPPVSRQ